MFKISCAIMIGVVAQLVHQPVNY